FIFFKLINFNIFLGISEILVLEYLFQSCVIFSTIFVILFLPTYPIFLILIKENNFSFLENLSLTIVVNSALYIFLGYIGYWISIPITGFFFFYLALIIFLVLIFIVIYGEWKNKAYSFIKPKKISKINQEQINKDTLYRFFKKKIHLNAILLILFIFLICIMNIYKFSYFVGTDPWLHILNSQRITNENSIPIREYHGELGLSIFGAIINFFSGLNHVLIPKFFIFYTFFVSALIFYNISLRVFKNQNLACFSVFILEFSSLGFSTMMLQYWPSGSALINCLAVFFLLYVRLQNFISLKRPKKKDILSNIFFFYIIITIIFISAVLTHVVTSIIFLISYIWLYFIYFLKDYKRGFDFIFLVGLFGIFLILSYFGIGSGHYWFLIPLNLSWYIILFTIIGGITAGAILFWRLQKSITFEKGRFSSVIRGEKNDFYKKIEDKIIIPLILSILILIVVILLIVNLFWLKIEIINIFYITEIILLSAFSIWGMILFQKKPRGKPIFIWGLSLIILLAIGFIFNILILSNLIWQRILYLLPPFIVIGFISYIYKLIRLNKFKNFRLKFIILIIITYSLFASYFYESVSYEVFDVKKRDVSPIQWYSNATREKNVIFTKKGWIYVFNYYDFLFNNQNGSFFYNRNFIFLKNETDLFPPNNHINESGINILQKIKNDYNTDVYIIFAGEYPINKEGELFGKLSKDELEEYYNLDYINKICSSKTMKGVETPLYWII
ncbi:MAG: hypothetical protein ACFFAN_20940, partial [Promethearchaeota archaeon]